MEQFWKIETSEALANSLPQFSVDDKRAVDIWKQSVEVVEGHYQLDIPFKSKLPNLSDNLLLRKGFSRWLIGSERPRVTRQVQGRNSRTS